MAYDKNMQDEMLAALERNLDAMPIEEQRRLADRAAQPNKFIKSTEEPVREDRSVWIEAVNVQPTKPKFLVPGIPANNITIGVGDGGVGKGFFSCNVAAATTTGNESVLGAVEGVPGRVLILNAEDEFSSVTLPKLANAGADLSLVTSFDASVRVPEIPEIIEGIRLYRPRLAIIDPLQSFVPIRASMERRNHMRKTIAPLQAVAAECDCAIMIIMHTNKRAGVFGRNRCADSSDIWDIARSVFIMGDTYDGEQTKYISHEKNSYGAQLPTKLCKIDALGIYSIGETDRKDRDFVHERDRHPGGRPPTQRSAAEQFIIDTLNNRGGEISGKQLADIAELNGINEHTLQRARSSLNKTGLLSILHSGRGSSHVTTIKLNENVSTV